MSNVPFLNRHHQVEWSEGEPPACPTCDGRMEVYAHDEQAHCGACEPGVASGVRFSNAIEALPRPGVPR